MGNDLQLGLRHLAGPGTLVATTRPRAAYHLAAAGPEAGLNFIGVLVEAQEGTGTPVEMILDPALQDAFAFDPDDPIVRYASSGEPTPYAIFDYVHTLQRRAQGEAVATHSGIWLASDEPVARFTVITDPLPLPLVLACVAAGVCLVQAGMTYAMCREALREAMQGCVAENGFPRIQLESHFGLSQAPPRVGCNVTCVLTCSDSSGRIISRIRQG